MKPLLSSKIRVLSFLKSLEAYVIEYAGIYDEATNNLFEEGHLYPVFQCKMKS